MTARHLTIAVRLFRFVAFMFVPGAMVMAVLARAGLQLLEDNGASPLWMLLPFAVIASILAWGHNKTGAWD